MSTTRVPTFTKSGVSTFTFDRAPLYPTRDSRVSNQSVAVSTGGKVQVRTFSTTIERIFSLSFQFLSEDSIDNIIAFFDDSAVNWRANSFTYTDVDNISFDVRLWQDSLSFDRGSNTERVLQISLRVET